jgi:hypothetical protein
MTTVFLYIFLFSTWGLGLLSWVVALGHFLTKGDLELKDKTLDIEQKKLLINKLNSLTNSIGNRMPSFAGIAPIAPKELPEKIKELMKSSPTHPEVEEIEPDDQIIGVRFEAENYPPGFGDLDEE